MSHYFGGVMGRTADDSLWTSVGEYLGAVDGKVGINQGYLVPHGSLRLETIGWMGRSATSVEKQHMAGRLRQGIEDGALGMSSGLTYPPGMWADTSELIELCAVVREMGGVYATHVRYTLGDGVLDGFREAIAISRASQVPLHISHFYVPAVLRGNPARMLAIIDDARAQGVDVTFDAYTYEYGSSTLASILPAWAHTEGPDGLLRHLRNESFRERLRAEGPPKWPANRMLVASTVAPQDKECEGRMVSDIAESRGQDVWDAIVDMLCRSDLEVSFTVETGDCGDIAAFVTHDAFMVGSDSILVDGHSNPRTYGTFPRLLEMYVRQRKCLSLENAIRKMTWLPAQRFGLAERGLLRDNARADIVVFDPVTVGTSSTLLKPNVFPVGIDHVFVNGVSVLENGKMTGATPGTALKRRFVESCA
jgi:N-acyl-D-amino-acid deacylase